MNFVNEKLLPILENLCQDNPDFVAGKLTDFFALAPIAYPFDELKPGDLVIWARYKGTDLVQGAGQFERRVGKSLRFVTLKGATTSDDLVKDVVADDPSLVLTPYVLTNLNEVAL